MQQTAADNSDLVSLYSAGKSYESRDLKVMVLRTATSKKGIWIGESFKLQGVFFISLYELFNLNILILDCGIHAVSFLSNK